MRVRVLTRRSKRQKSLKVRSVQTVFKVCGGFVVIWKEEGVH